MIDHFLAEKIFERFGHGLAANEQRVREEWERSDSISESESVGIRRNVYHEEHEEIGGEEKIF